MKIKFYTTTILICTLCCISCYVLSQDTEGKAKVLACDPPYNKIKVDMLGDDIEFIQEMSINPTTKIKDKKGNAVLAETLRPGSELEIKASKIQYVNQICEIKVLNAWNGSVIEFDGLIEQYNADNDYAVIGGEKIKMETGAKTKIGYKTKTKIDNLSQITLGYKVKGEGIRKKDGYIYATEITINENTFDKDDIKVKQALGVQFNAAHIDSVSIPSDMMNLTGGITSLPKGYASFGDAQFKITDDLKLQGYVNYVGNKVVPEYISTIPFDAPEHIKFRFIVIDNPTFNAFSLPNGLIFIHTGLLAKLDNEAQLASILGHEVAHVIYKHAKERYEGQEKLRAGLKTYITGKEVKAKLTKVTYTPPTPTAVDMIVMMVYDVAMGDMNAALSEAQGFLITDNPLDKLPPQTKSAALGLLYGLRGLASSSHGKENENQSDRVGLFYAHQAGYDPREAAKVWEKFMGFTLKGGTGNILGQITNTASDWALNSNMYPHKNPLQQAGDMITSKLVSGATDNWFSSHPKAKKRFRNLNQLVASNYADEDLSQYIVGVDEYKEVKSKAEQAVAKK